MTSGACRSSAARIARRRHRNMPAFQATPGSPQLGARAGVGFSSNAASGYAAEPADVRAARTSGTQVAVLGGGPRRRRRRASRAATRRRMRPSASSSAAAREHRAERALARRVDPVVGRQHDHHVVRVAVDASVARAIAGAVLRPSGSTITRDARAPARARGAPYAGRGHDGDVRGSSPSSGPRSRPTVRWSSVSPPGSSGRNGLGRCGGAQRPQPRAAAPGHDHDVHRAILGSGRTPAAGDPARAWR